ncbi:MAG: anaerobic ribonucleoside-triphosphate reductase activating protein [Patescibacteria group bacterium]|nr:anaerobic ribonucleoside-triphosphate reductase activating protein [Patescibacteria group bacterium]MDD5121070.1 anaerobic ribonucleoside-triphosphate reductase activating protein [Patescibacteria group bacterium]MDD5221568.1 anaerobic ribonucleoside-triphosphate reductase activating protein [Patescibacteria group bacterium]MDD5396011.1 anaerobic ribonucleoside-triphosphate reductase activating protein [Patescibacteria group bacterium]
MIFRGWQKNSLIEWPDKISTVVFVGGCTFACPWCHNRDLVFSPEKFEAIDGQTVLDYLAENRKFLDGVMISGGEPLAGLEVKSKADDFLGFVEKIKELGLGVGIETNGSNPDFLEYLLKNDLIDYVAMDIKAPLVPEKYKTLSGVDVDLEKIKKSIELIKNLALDYEFRTTVVPGMLTEKDLIDVAEAIKGAKRFYLQEFKPELVPHWPHKPFLRQVSARLKEKLKDYFEIFDIRL